MYKLELFTDIELDGIDHADYPDYCDAYACNAAYNGRQATDEELDYLNNEHSDYIYELVLSSIF